MCRILQNFCQKLHENEENSVERGRPNLYCVDQPLPTEFKGLPDNS